MAGGRPQRLAQCGRRFARCGRKVSEEGCWCFLRVGGGEGREGGLGLTSTKAVQTQVKWNAQHLSTSAEHFLGKKVIRRDPYCSLKKGR